MIAIVNVSPEVLPFGVHTYELRINEKVIATFQHKREDSLATCLRKAAAAADKAHWMELAELLDMASPPDDGLSFTCPVCQRVSYHPQDIRNRYCGNCHRFMEDV